DIEQIIRLTADDQLPVGFDNAFGTGRINALRALQSLQAPNTLQHLSATGGTIFSTTANMTRIFLGVPGLADAAYIVKRSEIRKAIILPAMCTTIGVWGRGVGTTGYREENGRCFGEGICEIVPGTLTPTGCTLRTFIYEVWTALGQYVGFYPSNANNAVFQYTILGLPAPTSIAGDDAFCTTTSNNYTIPNLPTGATVTWSASPLGMVTPNSPNSPQTTLTKNGNGVITLTAIISNTCGGAITITKQQIAVGSPSTGPINTPLITPYDVEVYVDAVPGASSYNWYNNNILVAGQHRSDADIPFAKKCTTYSISVEAVNICGTSTKVSKLVKSQCLPSYSIAPNPTTGILTISPAKVDNNAESAAIAAPIQSIKIVDNLGVVRKIYNYGKPGITNTSISLSDFLPGVYNIFIFDGTTWTTQSAIKQ
ncbi:MAG: T9SS type A sorting domain-containing protein, partial [Ferruginibacter sp.]